MPADEVALEHDDGVAVITIDRPGSRNAIALSTAAALDDVLDDVERAPDVATVVLRGAGDRAFVSGGDLKELDSIRTTDGAVAMATRVRRLLDRVSSFPVPVIAALNGHAFGGGAEVAVAADVRVMAAHTRIGFTQASLGIMPAWGGAERLAETVGRSKALLLVATGRQLDADEALAIGLVEAVFASDGFEAGWRDLARQVADLGPAATRSMKGVVARAKPHVHVGLESDAVDAFARLWVADRHWELAARRAGA